MSRKPETPLARVRRICLALPEAIEKTAWNAPTFRVGKGKIFAMFADDHHGDGRIGLWLHSKRDTQQLLVESDPNLFFVPPYVGPGGWVGVHVDRSSDAVIEDLAWRAWCGVASPKVRAAAEAARASPGSRRRARPAGRARKSVGRQGAATKKSGRIPKRGR